MYTCKCIGNHNVQEPHLPLTQCYNQTFKCVGRGDKIKEEI